jgi:hypothetical protein
MIAYDEKNAVLIIKLDDFQPGQDIVRRTVEELVKHKDHFQTQEVISDGRSSSNPNSERGRSRRFAKFYSIVPPGDEWK